MKESLAKALRHIADVMRDAEVQNVRKDGDATEGQIVAKGKPVGTFHAEKIETDDEFEPPPGAEHECDHGEAIAALKARYPKIYDELFGDE